MTIATSQTVILTDLVEDLKTPQSAIVTRYFPVTSTFDTEVVQVDVEKGRRTIAPLVSPRVPGRPQTRAQHQTNLIKPAYVKPKVEFDPDTTPVERQLGEPIGGNLSAQERHDRALFREMSAQDRQLIRREELMGTEALRTGKLTLVGEDYPATTVDFQRDATLSPAALAGGELWSAATPKIAAKLEALAKLVRKASGVNPIDVIMGEDAFGAFIEDAAVKGELDNRGITGSALTPGIEVSEGLTFQGVFRKRNVFTYSGWYVDPADDTEKEIWPAKVITLASPGEFGVKGRRFYGAIKDPKAGFAAVRSFVKMWTEEDPAVTWLMSQSAPLVAPLRPDASLSIQVLA